MPVRRTISPPLLNKTKPLKLLKISGAFSFLAFCLGQICSLLFPIEPELSP